MTTENRGGITPPEGDMKKLGIIDGKIVWVPRPKFVPRPYSPNVGQPFPVPGELTPKDIGIEQPYPTEK